MSKLTDALLRSIDYEKIAKERISNYKVLEELLGKNNAIHLTMQQDDVPMVYPYLTENLTLKQRLIANRIFVATYWPNVDANCDFEAKLKTNLLPLPIDQRYGEIDMKRITDIIKIGNQNKSCSVTIRPLVVEDAKTSYKWRNDRDVFRYTGNTYNSEISYDTELEWIKKVILNKNEYRCAIVVDDLYVGNIYLTNIDEDSAEYQIFIGDKNYWGKGVAKQASLQILAYAFEILKITSVYLNVNDKNEKAIHLYESIGFIIEKESDGWIRIVITPNTFYNNGKG